MLFKATPPKTKRQRALEESLEKAREVKMSHIAGEKPSASAESEVQSDTAVGEDNLAYLVTMPEDTLDTDVEAVDPCFDLDSSIKSNVDHLEECFCEEWSLTSREKLECH